MDFMVDHLSSKIMHEEYACPGTVLSLGTHLQLKATIKKGSSLGSFDVMKKYEP